jgi:hypothetical protein
LISFIQKIEHVAPACVQFFVSNGPARFSKPGRSEKLTKSLIS